MSSSGSPTDTTSPSSEPNRSLAPPPGRPSRRGYLIAAVIAVAGLVVGVGGLVLGLGQLSHEVEAFQRVDVPGRGTVHFAAGGDFTVYYEAAGATGGEGVTVSLPPVQVALTREHGGEPVRLEKYNGSFDYSIAGREGTAVATVHVDTPGRYVVTTEADLAPGMAEIAVGKGLAGDMARALLPGLVLLLALVAATVVAVVTAVRRRRSSGRQGGTFSDEQPAAT